METLLKIATITALIVEIGDCDEIQLTLDGFIKTLTTLKEIDPTNIASIILTPAELECELGEAYRQGKKDGKEDFEKEVEVAPQVELNKN